MRPARPIHRAAAVLALSACASLSGCAHPPEAPPPVAVPSSELPEVICERCGDFVPHGFTCAGEVMLRDDVPRARWGELKKRCRDAAKKRTR